MFNYQKTELGFKVLKDRSIALNARQRRLLLLIGSDDFNQMQSHHQQRIAEASLLQQLVELDLIQYCGDIAHVSDEQTILFSNDSNITQTTAQSENHLEAFPALNSSHLASKHNLNHSFDSNQNTHDIPSNTPQQSTSLPTFEDHHKSFHKELVSENLVFIEQDFETLQLYMCNLLHQYCGLMAKKLVISIQNTEEISQLKSCQMQWTTLLNESHIQPKLLRHALQQVNYSLNHLQTAA
ncbi:MULTISPECIES: hypothetical protein [unclassified Acinetobacter]|uniref:hypothetical protein n=1 Tax=unclassified Acinetobacter TaxID=196816 RepID=UPI0015D34E2D|nr:MULTISPECIES: hypothetical protein [unclassified Acinetobacter]